MNPKQSIGVVLMLSLLAPVTACGGDTQGGGDLESPAVTSPASSTEGGEGGEGGEGEEQKKNEGGEGGEG